MAKFKIQKLKWGSNTSFSLHATLCDVIFEPDDEIIYIPDTYKGEKLTHIGYVQGFEEAYERWHDWHHPAQGMEYVPERNFLSDRCRINVPSHIKKIVIPESATSINPNAFVGSGFELEISPDNVLYTVKDGKIVRK